MTKHFQMLIVALEEFSSVTKHRYQIDVDRDLEQVSVSSGDRCETCPVTFTVLHEQSVDISIGQAAHYEVYDARPDAICPRS